MAKINQKTKQKKNLSYYLDRILNTAVPIFEENCCHLEGLILVIKIQEDKSLHFLCSTVREKTNRNRRYWEKSNVHSSKGKSPWPYCEQPF